MNHKEVRLSSFDLDQADGSTADHAWLGLAPEPRLKLRGKKSIDAVFQQFSEQEGDEDLGDRQSRYRSEDEGWRLRVRLGQPFVLEKSAKCFQLRLSERLRKSSSFS